MTSPSITIIFPSPKFLFSFKVYISFFRYRYQTGARGRKAGDNLLTYTNPRAGTPE
jgi:hypothetical protein